MIKVLLLITGGAIGTVFRYGVSTWVQRSMLHSFPFGILSVNVIGSFLIGFCWSIAETCNLSAGALLNLIASNVLGLLAVFLGLLLGKNFMSLIK